MEIYIIALRLIHFIAGTYWLGVGLFSVLFLTPVLRDVGPEGQAVMRHLVGKTRFPLSMSLAAFLTVTSGAVLFWRVSGHLSTPWIQSTSGSLLTLGAIAGLIGFMISTLVQSRSAHQLAALGKAIETAGKPPLAEQLAQMRLLQLQLTRGAQVIAVLLVISLVGMSVWRYIYS